MPISRKSRKNSKSMKKSLTNKKVNCKDLIKTPTFKMQKQFICFSSYKKDNKKCHNVVTKIILNQCKEKNKNSNNSSNKKQLTCKEEVKKPLVKELQTIICKKNSKKDKQICENIFKKDFVYKCNASRKTMKSMKRSNTSKRNGSKNRKVRKTRKSVKGVRKMNGGEDNLTFLFVSDNNKKTKQKINNLINKNTTNSKLVTKTMLKPNFNILFLIYNNEIVGEIVGLIKDENETVSILTVEIKDTYLINETNSNNIKQQKQSARTKGITGTALLTEYINKMIQKYPTINKFTLYNTGGKHSCDFYLKVFSQLGYKIENKNVIDCENNTFIDMTFTKNS